MKHHTTFINLFSAFQTKMLKPQVFKGGFSTCPESDKVLFAFADENEGIVSNYVEFYSDVTVFFKDPSNFRKGKCWAFVTDDEETYRVDDVEFHVFDEVPFESCRFKLTPFKLFPKLEELERYFEKYLPDEVFFAEDFTENFHSFFEWLTENVQD